MEPSTAEAKAGSTRGKRIYPVGPRRELFESEAAAVLFHGFLALGRADQYRCFYPRLARATVRSRTRDGYGRRRATASTASVVER